MNLKRTPHLKSYSPSRIAAMAIAFALILCIAWTGAWLLEKSLEHYLDWMNTSAGRSIYWLIMKLLIWILPSIVLIKLSGSSFREVMGFKRLGSIIIWGGGVGLILGTITIINKTLEHQPLFLFHLSWPFFGGVITSPIIEEITFRGAILSMLKQRYS